MRCGAKVSIFRELSKAEDVAVSGSWKPSDLSAAGGTQDALGVLRSQP